MKRFISKKRIKLPRYKIIILKLLSIFLILTFLNISLNFFLTKINNNHLLSILNTNSFGSLSSFIFSKENLLYNNIYGLNLHNSKETSTKTPNKTALNLSPIVYIYNTFQTSKYKNTYYNSYNITPQITHASLIFQEYLKNNGIPSLVEKGNVAQTLKENNLAYTNSYQASRLLLEKSFNENPSLTYFLDFQISNETYANTTITLNNKNYAKILIIIGTDNPNYSQNEILATAINQKLIEFNPNLTNGIKYLGGQNYQGVYNEDFNPNTLLIEIGGHENTISEVNNTLNVLAKIFSAYIKEQK